MGEEINTIVECAENGRAHYLFFYGLKSVIPMNAIRVHDRSKQFVLYAYLNSDQTLFKTFTVKPPRNGKLEGWPIINYEPNFRYIYDAQRAIITRDGRFFVDTLYMRKGFRSYLDSARSILAHCSALFKDEKLFEKFENNPPRVIEE